MRTQQEIQKYYDDVQLCIDGAGEFLSAAVEATRDTLMWALGLTPPPSRATGKPYEELVQGADKCAQAIRNLDASQKGGSDA